MSISCRDIYYFLSMISLIHCYLYDNNTHKEEEKKLYYDKKWQNSKVEVHSNPMFTNVTDRFLNILNYDGDRKESDVLSLSWAVYIPQTISINGVLQHEMANDVADELNLINNGQIGALKGHYLFVHNSFYDESKKENIIHRNSSEFHLHYDVNKRINQHDKIKWSKQDIVRKRFKRGLQFHDQFFPSQWHLDNLKFVGHDINVTGVWENNITGHGIVVSVIDDGVEWTNPDILDNYSSEGSWDLNSNDDDPMPRLDESGLNHHGTRCAGEIAAVANEYCAVGVAYGAKVSGVRILDGPMTDSLEAMAFNTKMEVNDVYSCSWGPDDNGKTVDGPHQLAQAALAHGVMTGRKGYGSIYVVASGNGGHFKDNCNFDGYANSIFTVTIGAVDELGHMPYYAEHCAAMLAVTYSSGKGQQRNIVTTDWRLGTGTGCTDRHTGTSAAAPLAAGIIALMLEARYCLTWRDVQHLMVHTAVHSDVGGEEEWHVNGAGFSHSHTHGFGLLSSWRLVTASRIWPAVPYMTSWSSKRIACNNAIPASGARLVKRFRVLSDMATEIASLEHVTITVKLQHHCRGSIVINLVSPSGTVSKLATPRKYDRSSEGFKDWTFSTVRCWGESPKGTWSLIVIDSGGKRPNGELKSWQLTFYGSLMTHEEIEERRRLVKESYGGHLLKSKGPPCPLPYPHAEEIRPMSSRLLKVVFLLSAFFSLVGFYFLMESFCNISHAFDDDKDASEDEPDMYGFHHDDSLYNTEESVTLNEHDLTRLSLLLEQGNKELSSTSLTLGLSNDSPIGSHFDTPEELARALEFENRLKFAMEQSMILQTQQKLQLDELRSEINEAVVNIEETDSSAQVEKKVKKKKLKGILKKPKQYKD